MRMVLHNYLKVHGHTTVGLARKIGRSRETVRRWADNPDLTTTVEFDPVSGDVHQVEVGKMKVIKGVNGEKL